MVQKKAPSKLGIQAEHVKSEKRPGNLKPASGQHQDGKSRGPDMKTKKMKRARSIKLSDTESLTSSSLQGKLHPTTTLTTPASPKKQPVVKAGNASPNYMKSTSSFEARKERSTVSSFNTPSCFDGKNLRQKNFSALKHKNLRQKNFSALKHKNLRQKNFSALKHTSASSNKTVKMLKKLSSLKLVRNLTKIPNFKPVRGTIKKCSRGLALCEEVKVPKATCSSTLKDSKFPAYLMLNPGGTEAEGTSVMKVCPYTYCSLNGHYHTPLPPLKCFLKAKRRSLKTQKSTKLEIIAQPRANPSGDSAEEIPQGLLGSPDRKALIQGRESPDLEHVPVMQKVGKDFFIEIYEKHAGAAAEKGTQEDDSELSPLEIDPEDGDNRSWYGGDNKVEQDSDKLGLEHPPDQSPASIFNFVDRFEEYSDTSSIDIYVSGASQENQTPEECTSILYQEHATSLCREATREIEISSWMDTPMKCRLDLEEDTTISDLVDMEWEDAPSSVEIDDEDNDLNRAGVGSLHNLVKEATPSFQEKSNETSSENIYPTNEWEIHESFQPPCRDTIEEQTNMSDTDSIFTWPTSNSTEESAPDSMAGMVNFYGDGEDQLKKRALETIPQVMEAEILDRKDGASDGQITEPYAHNKGAEDSSSYQGLSDDCNSTDPKNKQLNNRNRGIKDHNIMKQDLDEANKRKIPSSTVVEEQSLPDSQHKNSDTICSAEVEKTDAEDSTKSDTTEPFLTANKGNNQQRMAWSWHKGPNPSDRNNNNNHRRWTIGCGKPINDLEEEKLFNPREPNFLPAVPDPEAEKVDLKHNMMDDRKNAEEWMIDYALQQAVTKLAPARKKKVALIIEAFETVLPPQKYDTNIRHSSAAFSPRPIQACS